MDFNICNGLAAVTDFLGIRTPKIGFFIMLSRIFPLFYGKLLSLLSEIAGVASLSTTEITKKTRFNPFQNKPWLLRVWGTSLLKTLWEKKKSLVTSNFLIFPQCFLPFGRTFCPFHQI